MKNKITVGSRAFFSGYNDFKSKDCDYLELVETPTGFKWRKEQSLRGTCTFTYKKEPVDKMVQRTIESGDPLLVGKFLVPEVAHALGASVNDILPLEVLLPKLDDKHRYIALIFEAIKQNNSFSISDDQRAAAYAAYKQQRQPKRRT